VGITGVAGADEAEEGNGQTQESSLEHGSFLQSPREFAVGILIRFFE
jgi:hypothetical protein